MELRDIQEGVDVDAVPAEENHRALIFLRPLLELGNEVTRRVNAGETDQRSVADGGDNVGKDLHAPARVSHPAAHQRSAPNLGP